MAVPEEIMKATEKAPQTSAEFVQSSEKEISDPSSRIEITAENSQEASSGEKDTTYSQILSKVKSATTDDDAKANIAQDASEAHSQMDRASQLQHLLDLAMTKGVEHAIATAEHLDDYYLLDKLHDQMLHDEFYEKLVAQGLLKTGK